jgi:hypothetical protein
LLLDKSNNEGSNERLQGSNANNNYNNNEHLSRELDMSEDKVEDGKVTFMAHFQSLKSLVFGTKEGRLTFVTLRKGKEKQNCDFESFYVNEEEDRDGMRKIIQVIELPSMIKEISKHIYYILTNGNLYVQQKGDKNEIGYS